MLSKKTFFDNDDTDNGLNRGRTSKLGDSESKSESNQALTKPWNVFRSVDHIANYEDGQTSNDAYLIQMIPILRRPKKEKGEEHDPKKEDATATSEVTSRGIEKLLAEKDTLTDIELDLQGLKGDEEPPSKLRLEDNLLFMEIRNKITKEIVATCCKNYPYGYYRSQLFDFSSIKDSKQEPFTSFLLAANYVPSCRKLFDNDDYTAVDDHVFELLEMTVRLIRRDNGTSVSFGDYASRGQSMGYDNQCIFETFVMKPNAFNPSDTVARKLCFKEQYHFAEFEPVAALERLSKYEYTIKNCTFDLRVCLGDDDCANDQFESTNHLLLFMEGLDWK